MQRLHEDDLVGHVLERDDWEVLRFPAIAEQDEVHEVESPLLGRRVLHRRAGEALHPDREPLETLKDIRANLGEYNFAGQYQQSPAPFGGGMVKKEWFKTYNAAEWQEPFPRIVQSWDTANTASELSDFSVCTTWGVRGANLYLIDVYRERLDYPSLKRAVLELARVYGPRTILIEDRASGTQLLQDLVYS